jgi:hypothetical protein
VAFFYAFVIADDYSPDRVALNIQGDANLPVWENQHFA